MLVTGAPTARLTTRSDFLVATPRALGAALRRSVNHQLAGPASSRDVRRMSILKGIMQGFSKGGSAAPVSDGALHIGLVSPAAKRTTPVSHTTQPVRQTQRSFSHSRTAGGSPEVGAHGP